MAWVAIRAAFFPKGIEKQIQVVKHTAPFLSQVLTLTNKSEGKASCWEEPSGSLLPLPSRLPSAPAPSGPALGTKKHAGQGLPPAPDSKGYVWPGLPGGSQGAHHLDGSLDYQEGQSKLCTVAASACTHPLSSRQALLRAQHLPVVGEGLWAAET